jgi:DNA polymerase-3 subunit epsilon
MDYTDGCVVFDTETTGLNVETDDVVQLGCIVFPESNPGNRTRAVWLANPGRDVPEAATAVHGITTQAVKSKLPSRTVVQAWWEEHQHHAVFVGHNIRSYDMPLLAKHIDWPDDLPVIDTLHLAQRIDPHSPDHKLETLYRSYRLGVERNLTAHSALDDCEMALELLLHYQARLGGSLKTLACWLSDPVRLTVMPFGRYKGKHPLDVPKQYARSLLTKTLSPDMRYTLVSVLSE